MSMGLIDQLERLSALKAQGALTDEEFSLAKKKLLEEPGAAGRLPRLCPLRLRHGHHHRLRRCQQRQ